MKVEVKVSADELIGILMLTVPVGALLIIIISAVSQ